MNNVYVVSRTDGVGYDEYDSFVVVASDEEEARNTHPSNNSDSYIEHWGSPWDEKYRSWISKSEIHTLDVEHIGTSIQPCGVILSSFNAG